MKRKIQAILLAFIVVAARIPIAFSADTTLSEKIITELKAFGIMYGDENNDLKLDDYVTRAEFSAMMTRTLDIGNWAYSDFGYDDVTAEDWFYADVMRLCMTGCINGTADGIFSPYDNITREQAAKIIVTALGYGFMAERSGGYPDGYVSVAVNIGVFSKTASTGAALTRGEVAQMLYNCLDITIFEHVTGDGLKMNSDYTLREAHLYDDNRGVFVKRTGIVTATPQIWLVKAYPDIEDDEVVIDGVVMKTGGTDAAKYIGMEVDYYAMADERDGEFTLRAAVPTRLNSVTEFDEVAYIGKNGDTLNYETESRTKTCRLSPFCVLIRNMRIITSPSDEDYDIKRGNIRAVDNNGDDRADYLFIEEFESVKVDRVTGDTIWFDTSTPYNGKKMLDLGENDDISFFLEDVRGNSITMEDIISGDVLSIISDKDTVYRLIRSDVKPVRGAVTKLIADDDIISIDTEDYRIESQTPIDAEPGTYAKFLFNFRGEIVFCEAVKYTERYGYVAGVFRDEDDEGILIKLVIPGEFNAQIKINDEVEDNEVQTHILKGSNSDIKIFRLADKANVFGSRVTVNNVNDRLTDGDIISYTLNGDGEISKIEQPVIVGEDILSGDRQRHYNGHEQIFGGINAGAFAVESTTSVLCIPDNSGVEENNDFLAEVEILDGSSYHVNGYDLTAENEVAKLIVIRMPLRYRNGSGYTEQSEAIVESVRSIVDEDNDVTAVVTYWQDGERFEKQTEPDYDVTWLGAGDVILMSVGVTTDKIAGIQRLARLEDVKVGTINMSSSVGSMLDGTVSIGYPLDIEFGRIHDLNNRRADFVTLGLDEENIRQKTFYINVRNTPNIYVYHKRDNRIEPADTRYIEPGRKTGNEPDMVVVYERSLKTQLVVIVTQ